MANFQTNDFYYEANFGVSRAFGFGNTKIVFLKARQRRAFKKTIFIARIAGLYNSFFCQCTRLVDN